MILQPTAENILFAAEAIRRGELVVMPTETVYGLAANICNETALEAIFTAKNRPHENPLIVHIAHLETLSDLVEGEIPEEAMLLGKTFWPGPLTLVLPKKSTVSPLVSAGRPTLAVRMPAHPVALDLIEASGCALAAPSANRFMQISPTRAEDIDLTLASQTACILDGGACQVGIESTVLDLTGEEPVLLRPGVLSKEKIAAVLEREIRIRTEGEHSSPGMYARHYAPETPLILVDALPSGAPGLTFASPTSEHQIHMPLDPAQYAARLYAALKQLDVGHWPKIYAEKPPTRAEWMAIWDRLSKASSSE